MSSEYGGVEAYCQAHICGDVIEDDGLCSICRKPPHVKTEFDRLRDAAQSACEAEFTTERLAAMKRLRVVLEELRR